MELDLVAIREQLATIIPYDVLESNMTYLRIGEDDCAVIVGSVKFRQHMGMVIMDYDRDESKSDNVLQLAFNYRTNATPQFLLNLIYYDEFGFPHLLCRREIEPID